MFNEVKSLNEECGVFGVWGHPDAARVTYFDYTVCNIATKKVQGLSRMMRGNSMVP